MTEKEFIPIYLSMVEASARLGLTHKQIRDFVSRKALKCYWTEGGHRNFLVKDIEIFNSNLTSYDLAARRIGFKGMKRKETYESH